MMKYQWFDVQPSMVYPLQSIEVHMETADGGIDPRPPHKFESWSALQTYLMDLQQRVEEQGGAVRPSCW